MADELDGSIARYLGDVIEKQISNRLTDGSAIRKAIVKRVDEQGVVWAHIVGGPDTTPIVEAEGTFKAGDLIDVTIENGIARGKPSTSTQTISMAYLAAALKAAFGGSVKELADFGDIDGDGTIVADTVIAASGVFDNLVAKDIYAENLTAQNANIQNLTAENAQIKNLVADDATINNLRAQNATIASLIGTDAYIQNLLVDRTNIGEAVIGKADVNFANVISQDTAYSIIQNLLVHSGWFKYVEVDQQRVGYLDAVRIDAFDVNIEHLAVKDLYLFDDTTGTDGIWYQLNVTAGGITYSELTPEMQAKVKEGFHGDNIIAGTVTADKIYVKDLAAFEATIAGMVFDEFQFGDRTYYKMHTFGKTTVNSAAPGLYVDQMGQFCVGTGDTFLMVYLDQNGQWKMNISADSIDINGTTVTSMIQTLQDQIDNVVETWFGSGEPTLSNYPASNWPTTELKSIHIGDIYYDNDSGNAYRFTLTNGSYSWVLIPDSAVVAALTDIRNAVMSVDIKYAEGNSPTSYSDISDSQWVTSLATHTAGKYVWQRTITTYGDNHTNTTYACIQGSKGDSGEDAYSLVISASNGSVFRNSEGTTTLTARVYRGSTEIDTGTPSTLTYNWTRKLKNGTVDQNFSATGKSIVVNADDVDSKATYQVSVTV